MSAAEDPLGRVVAKALRDEAFKQRLIADPVATLEAEGLTVPDGVDVRVVEDSGSLRHLLLPASGPGVRARLADEELAWLSGGIEAAPSEEEPWNPRHYPLSGCMPGMWDAP